MKKELRYFQNDSIEAISKSLKAGETPYINAVTGFGKSLVMADITDRAIKKDKRVLQLVPNHTLCVQNYKQLYEYTDHKSSIGICSAKESKFQIHKQAVIATQTSFLRRRHAGGKFDLLLVDECDMISLDEKSTYQRIIKALRVINKNIKIVGLTGSPFRKDQGMLHDKIEGKNVIFTECCYESDIPTLIKEGYISSVKMLNNSLSVDLDGVKVVRGDYDQQACGVKFNKIVADAVKDFKRLFEENNIKTSLIFASTIENGNKIVEEYGNDSECKLAHGKLTEKERNDIIHWLKNGSGKRCLVNVGLYTRGFDFPGLESIVLLRATTSLRLYVQIIGRLLRTHDEKEFGFLADYGGNVERFGPIDNLIPPKVPEKKGTAPTKECTAINEGVYCGEQNNLSAKRCKKCKAEFINESEDGLYQMRTRAEALKAKQEETFSYDVQDVYFEHYQKDETPILKMLFYDEHVSLLHTEYICLNHSGSARGLAIAKIQSLLKNKKDYYQISQFEDGVCVKSVLFLLQNRYQQFFKPIKKITLQKDGRFNKLISWEF